MAQKFLTDIEVTRGLVDSSGDLGVAGQVLSSTGTGTNWITNEANSTVVYQDGFTGDNSTVDFTLSVSVTDENVTQVYIDGVYQNKDTYSVSNTTLTFSTAPPLNADIEVITFSTATTADDLQAGVVIIPVKNTHTASIAKGEPVYITGNVGSSARLQIAPADASNSAKMPSAGLLLQTLAVNAEGYVVTGGYLRNLTTDVIDGTSTSSNMTVYVKAGGGLTVTKPTGPGNLIQNVAKVASPSGGNAGSLLVSSILRTNDIPNLTTGKIWVGDGNTTESTVVHLDETNGRMGIGNTSPNARLDVSGQIITSDSIKFTGNVSTPTGNTIFRPTSNTLAFGTASTERMRIDSSGSVGIGTTSLGTEAKLAIGHTSTSEGGQIVLHKGTNGTYAPHLDAYYSGGIDYLRILKGTNTATSAAPFVFDLTNDRLGIGTTSPSYKLQVNGTAYINETLYVNGATTVDDNFYVTNGNVGIGTTSPSAKLEIEDSGADLLDLTRTSVGTYRLAISTTDKFSIYDVGAASDRLVIDSSGNVMMGKNSQSGNAALTVKSTAGGNTGLILIEGDTTNDGHGLYATTDNKFVITRFTNGSYSDNFVMDSSGNVSIGTTNAVNSKLYVANAGVANLIIGYNNTSNNYFDADTQIFRNSSAVERMRIDSSGNVGIGETPSSWSAFTVLQVEKASLASTGGDMNLMSNSYYDGTAYKYIGSGAAARQYYNTDGTMHFYNASSGTAGGTVTWNERMRIDSSGLATFKKSGTNARFYDGSTSSTGAIEFGLSDFIFGYDSGVFKHKIWDGADYFNAIEYNGPAHRLILAPSEGNVGIGTTSPDSKLNINGASAHLNFTGSNNRINFSGYRAIEGSHTGSLLQIGEGYSNIVLYGNVGIGTTSPSQKLVVSNGNIRIDSTNNANHLIIQNNATGTSGTFEERIKFLGWNDNENAAIIGIGNAYFGSPVNALAFSVSASEKMRILHSGNVGIGTTSPSSKFHVYGNGTVARLQSSSSYVDMLLSSSGNTGFLNLGSTGMNFYVNGGSASNLHMHISNAGNVGIGLTNPDAKLEVTGGGSAYTFRSVYSGTNGSYAAGAFQLTGGSTGPSLIDFIYSTTFVGQIVTTGTAVLYQSNSDYRLKENVVEMTGALDRVSQLKPNRFNFIADANTTVDGFLAHELQQVVPQAVSGEKDETREDGTPKYQGVDHSQIVPLLVGAIQELKQEIETLKLQING